MIKIDKKDKLYTYLTNLGVEDVESTYTELATQGRFSPSEVQTYFYSVFQPSLTEDVEENELNLLLDYYADLKKCKSLSQTELNNYLKQYKQHATKQLKEKIVQAQLKDLLYLCINYKSTHKDADLQELVQLANLGLLTALEKYKPQAKIAFKHYVIYWVREEIEKENKNA